MAKTFNHWLTADIRIHRDSVGWYEAHHAYQGMLYETLDFTTRAEARREAVNILREKKEEAKWITKYGDTDVEDIWTGE